MRQSFGTDLIVLVVALGKLLHFMFLTAVNQIKLCHLAAQLQQCDHFLPYCCAPCSFSYDVSVRLTVLHSQRTIEKRCERVLQSCAHSHCFKSKKQAKADITCG